MHDSTILEFTNDFIEQINNAFRYERDYFSHGNSAIYKEFKNDFDKRFEEGRRFFIDSKEGTFLKEWDESKLCPNSHLYPEICQLLNHREHPFQKWLDQQLNYNHAIKIFRKKKLFIPLDERYEVKKLQPLCFEVILDSLIASSIIRWNQIREKGIDYFIKIDKKHITKITKKANELLKAISEAPTSLGITRTTKESIERLANGSGRGSFDLEIAHIPRRHLYYTPNIKHHKSDREFLLRELITKYMMNFGLYELKQITKQNNLYSTAVVRSFCKQTKTISKKGKYWHYRTSPIIHADVIVNLLPTIDIELEDTSERKIHEYANKQRESLGYSQITDEDL